MTEPEAPVTPEPEVAAAEPTPVPEEPDAEVAAIDPGVATPLEVPVFPPSIDAIEIDGTQNFFAGSGQEGATVRLYVDDIYVADSKVEGGRWLVEAEGLLDEPSQRVRIDQLAPGSAIVVARAEVNFVIDLPVPAEPEVAAVDPATPEEPTPEVAAADPVTPPAEPEEIPDVSVAVVEPELVPDPLAPAPRVVEPGPQNPSSAPEPTVAAEPAPTPDPPVAPPADAPAVVQPAPEVAPETEVADVAPAPEPVVEEPAAETPATEPTAEDETRPEQEISVADATPVPPSRQLEVPAAAPEEPAEIAPPEDMVVADVPEVTDRPPVTNEPVVEAPAPLPTPQPLAVPDRPTGQVGDLRPAGYGDARACSRSVDGHPAVVRARRERGRVGTRYVS